MYDSEKLPFNFAMNINMQDESTDEALQVKCGDACCIALTGDFSGNGKVSDARFIGIDRYNFDEVLSSMSTLRSLVLDDHSDATPSAGQPVTGAISLVDAFIQRAIAGRKTGSRDPRKHDMIATNAECCGLIVKGKIPIFSQPC